LIIIGWFIRHTPHQLKPPRLLILRAVPADTFSDWVEFADFNEMSGRMPLRLAPLSLICLILCSACSREEVRSYRVPKETVPTMAEIAASTMPAATGETAASLTWQAPGHWADQGATGMRRGSFTITGTGDQSADLSIIAFPGDVGGMTANVNRWRGQVALPPLSAEEIQAALQHIDTPHFHMDLVSLTGEANGQATRIDGAIFSHGAETWFIKFMGPAALIETEAPHFRQFVETVAPTRN
jgi:hypothetical protein